MRKITKIIIHCSATKMGLDFRLKDIEQWHKERGFNMNGGTYCGYHVGAHARHYNQHSIGICYEGGLDAHGNPADTRTYYQCESLRILIKVLRLIFPEAKVYGHRDFANKDCPCFEVRNFFPTEWCGDK